MIRRLWLTWHLAADEKYLRILEREGWTPDELRALRHKCAALRVELALCKPTSSCADCIVVTASVLAGVALLVLELL